MMSAAICPALLTVLLSAPFERAGPAQSSAPDSVLDLDWVERTVLERNPTLAAAHETWHAARERAASAGSLEDPELEFMVAPRTLGNDAVDPAYRVGLTQRLPIFGERGLQRRAATFEGRASAYDMQAVRLDLLRDARGAFYDYFRIARNQQTTHEVIELVRKFRGAALAKYAAGNARQSDPLQADLELANLDHQATVLERERRLAVARLNTLLHLPQANPLPPPPRTLTVLEPPYTEAWLEERRGGTWPELRAAEARVEARRASLQLAGRQRLPEWMVGAGYDRFWSEPELRPSLSVGVNLPIFRGRSEAIASERAALAAAEHQVQAAQDRVELAIEQASATFRESLHDMEIMQERVVPASERAVDAVRAAYEANRSDFRDLIQAARDLSRARLELAEAQAAVLQAHAELRRALGSDPVPLSKEDQPGARGDRNCGGARSREPA